MVDRCSIETSLIAECIWHSNFWLGFIFEWKTRLLYFVLENIQNQRKWHGMTWRVFLFYHFPHILLEVWTKLMKVLTNFWNGSFKNHQLLAWSKMHTFSILRVWNCQISLPFWLKKLTLFNFEFSSFIHYSSFPGHSLCECDSNNKYWIRFWLFWNLFEHLLINESNRHPTLTSINDTSLIKIFKKVFKKAFTSLMMYLR